MKKAWRKAVLTTLTLAVASTSFLGTDIVKAQELSYMQDQSVKPNENEVLQRKIVGYFPGWAYNNPVQGNFMVTDLQWDDLTHIQYSFASVDPVTNKISLGNASEVKAAIGDDFLEYQDRVGPITHNGKAVTLDAGLSYKGHFNLLQVMKKQYPDVKVLVSVGGWASSRGFYTMIDTDAGINTFADSCVDFIREYGFDGVDIDFEYPSATSTSGNPNDQDLAEPRRAKLNERYNVLMRTLREKLDQAAKQDSKYYSLTAAVPASAWVLGGMTSGEYAKYLDFLSVMSYDFHGGWNGYVENLANIYSDSADTETEGQVLDYLSMEWAYDYYRGVLPPEKILMGIPYYTRGWEKVTKAGGAETGLHGTSIKTKITEKGWGADKECNLWGDDDNGDGIVDASGSNPLWHVLNLADKDQNYKKYWDNAGKVPYMWNEQRKTFLSFEDEDSIRERAKFIKEKNLGGALIWVMNGDYALNPKYDPTFDPTTVDRNDPNFVKESINKGKYIFGDTLTETLKSELDRMGNCIKTQDPWDTLPTTDVEVTLGITYDHPNGAYLFTIKNNTAEEIKGGWELAFDFPKSSKFNSCWDGTYTMTPNGDFNRITVSGGGWNGIKPGGTVVVKGQTKLCFSGVQHITFNGKKPINLANGNEQVVVDNKLLTADVKTSVATTDTGKYDVTAIIPANSKATSYTVFENDVAIKKGTINPQATNQVVEVISMANKSIGMYKYTVELANELDKTMSSVANVEVTKKQEPVGDKPAVPTIVHNNWDGKTSYDITFNMWWGVNGSEWKLYEDGVLIHTAPLVAAGNQAQSGTFKVSDKKAGVYKYKVELINAAGATTSEEITVEVKLNDAPKVLNEAPVKSEVPTKPETPIVPEVPTKPETPIVPEVPAKPEAPIVPEVPAKPEAPIVPEVAIVPEMPIVPEVPAEPEAPIVPEVATESEAPIVPETSIVPEVPTEPVK